MKILWLVSHVQDGGDAASDLRVAWGSAESPCISMASSVGFRETGQGYGERTSDCSTMQKRLPWVKEELGTELLGRAQTVRTIMVHLYSTCLVCVEEGWGLDLGGGEAEVGVGRLHFSWVCFWWWCQEPSGASGRKVHRLICALGRRPDPYWSAWGDQRQGNCHGVQSAVLMGAQERPVSNCLCLSSGKALLFASWGEMEWLFSPISKTVLKTKAFASWSLESRFLVTA